MKHAKRIDSQYFHPEYTKLENELKEKPHDLLGKLGKFITGPFGSAFHVENYELNSSTFRYIRGKDVKQFFLTNDDNVYIPEKDFYRLEKYSLEHNDILISVVGSLLGNVCIVDSEELPAIFSSKSTVFRTDSINPYFLLAYLNSNFGKSCLLRRARGAAQTGLNVEDLSTLPIVKFKASKQEEIGDMVKEALSLRKASQKLYKEAKDELAKSLKLNEIKIENKKTFVADYSEFLSNKRINAEFYSPTVKNILENKAIKENSVPLYKLFSIVRGISPANYIEEGVPILKTKNIREPEINIEKISDYVSESESMVSVQPADLLLASMGVGSLGRISYINKLDKDYYVDGTIRLLRKKETITKQIEVPTMLYLSTEIGQKLIYRGIVGSTGIISLPDDYLGKIPVPNFDEELCNSLTEKVVKSMEKKNEFANLLSEAKIKIEDYIKELI